MDIEKYFDLVRDTYADKFEKLLETLLEYNNMFNLTAITQKDDIIAKHFVDSCTGEGYIPQGANVVEIGSGGGFPSMPLKIIRDDLSLTLVESTLKKCKYLDICVDKLGMNNVKVMNMRAEEGGKDAKFREKFDVCIARAVARLNTLCEYCMPYVRVGGRFIAYKGDAAEEVEEAQRAVKVLGGEIEKLDAFELNGEKRTLVIIRKVAHTPPKYPRGQGRERKSPIV